MLTVFNHLNTNHLSEIKKQIKDADEVYISTAFLKLAGWKLLKPSIKSALNRGATIQLHCGLNFGITQADALYEVKELFDKYPNAALYMVYTKPSITYHPKYWVFIKKNTATVLAGSANLTCGGIEKNFEFSLLAEYKKSDKCLNAATSFFSWMLKEKLARPATYKLIAQYGLYQKEQVKKQREIKPTPPLPDKIDYDYKKLKEWYKDLKNQFTTYHTTRRNHYNKAKEVLDDITIRTKSKKEFIENYEKLVGGVGIRAYWKSGSIDRHKGDVFTDWKQFVKLVQYVRQNKNGTPSNVFSNAMVLSKKIRGVSANIVGEIMMTYNSQEFPNINANPITVLIKEAKCDLKKTYATYTGDDYSRYAGLMKEIMADLKFKNLLELDTFFNEIYWILKNSKKGPKK